MPVSGYFDTIFGVSGSLTAVPDATQSNGSVSYQQGYGILYSTPVASGGLNISRAQMNQIFNDITTAVQDWQQNTIAPFITTAMNGGTPYSYPQYVMVLYNGVAYQSNTAGNTDTPPSSKWNVANIGASSSFLGGTTTGSANAQVLASLTPATGFALTDQYSIKFTAGYTNTTAATLAITSPSVSATAIQKNSPSGIVALTGGEIVAGNEYSVTYNNAAGVFVISSGQPVLPVASAADTLTGTSVTEVLTPGGFAGNKSIAANGYYKLPGGLIFQWGNTGVSANGVATPVVFPIAFTNNIYSITATPNDATTTAISAWMDTITTTGMNLHQSLNATVQTFWMAIGN